MLSLRPTTPRLGKAITQSLVSTHTTNAAFSLNRSGSNGYRSFAGYKDNKVSGASFGASHSCTKIYYYV